jgi:protein TonB
VQAAKLVHRVIPKYPILAHRAGVEGVVKLEAVISADGVIRRLQLVSGHPLLVRAAMDAVKQWRYAPTLLSGRPVEVVTQIEVRFSLR